MEERINGPATYPPANYPTATAVCLALTVDGPDVSSVALTSTPGSDNTYAISDAVEATVTFDAAVDITGTPPPQLELDFAGTAKAASCATGTNTTTMVCEYEVATGDTAHERRRDRGEQAHRRHHHGHRQHDHRRQPHPHRGHDRRRPQGRRHPPDARHHRQRCADDVDRRHEGDPDLQRDHQLRYSKSDHHPGRQRHRGDGRVAHDWNQGRTHP